MKCTGYNEDDEYWYVVSKNDFLEWAEHSIGRKLNDEELMKAKDFIEWGMGENLMGVYKAVLGELENECR
jgi:hypothetical protein